MPNIRNSKLFLERIILSLIVCGIFFKVSELELYPSCKSYDVPHAYIPDLVNIRTYKIFR